MRVLIPPHRPCRTFQYNEMTGTMPSEIGQLMAMTSGLQFGWNDFTGKLPTQLGHLTDMEHTFRVTNNRFSQAIPTQLGRWTKLTNTFDLASNDFCNAVPTEVQALSSNVLQYWHVTTANNIDEVRKSRHRPRSKSRHKSSYSPWTTI